MKRAGEWEGGLAEFLKDYRFQPELTIHLDGLGSQPFAQDVINEIVLWKVNRYVELSPTVRDALNSVAELISEYAMVLKRITDDMQARLATRQRGGAAEHRLAGDRLLRRLMPDVSRREIFRGNSRKPLMLDAFSSQRITAVLQRVLVKGARSV